MSDILYIERQNRPSQCPICKEDDALDYDEKDEVTPVPLEHPHQNYREGRFDTTVLVRCKYCSYSKKEIIYNTQTVRFPRKD